MIIVKTPYRISFFGGGTDYKEWYQENGGEILSTSIDYFAYITLKKISLFFNHQYRVCWKEIEEVNNIEDIKHHAVKNALLKFNLENGISLHHEGDLPARSGLGSSSTFVVGMLNAIHTLLGSQKTEQELAIEAIDFEQNVLKENVGIQDQIAASYGGFNHTIISQDGSFSVKTPSVSESSISNLESHLLLFFTGLTRTASEIVSEQLQNLSNKKESLKEMQSFTKESINILNGSDITSFGNLLHESWLLKRSLSSKISNTFIDEIYEKAMQNGAIGGKLLGAGGGGFVLVFAKPQNHTQIKNALNNLIEIPVKFGKEGSKVIYNSLI